MNFYLNENRKKKRKTGKELKEIRGKIYVNIKLLSSAPEFSSHQISWEWQGGHEMGITQAASDRLS